MTHQITNSRPVTGGQNYVEIFIESVDDLANLPQEPCKICCLGSVAYTKDFDIYSLTNNGWELSS